MSSHSTLPPSPRGSRAASPFNPTPRLDGSGPLLMPSVTKNRVSQGLQDILIDMKALKRENKRLTELLRLEQLKRQQEEEQKLRALQALETGNRDSEQALRTYLTDAIRCKMELKRAIQIGYENMPTEGDEDKEREKQEMLEWLRESHDEDDVEVPVESLPRQSKETFKLAQRVKETMADVCQALAEVKWEKAKAEVTAKAYNTELLKLKKSSAMKKMELQVRRWRNLLAAKVFSAWLGVIREQKQLGISQEVERLKDELEQQKELKAENDRILAEKERNLEREKKDFEEEKAKLRHRLDHLTDLENRKKLAIVDKWLRHNKLFCGWTAWLDFHANQNKDKYSALLEDERDSKAAMASKALEREDSLKSSMEHLKQQTNEHKMRYIITRLQHGAEWKAWTRWKEYVQESQRMKIEDLLQAEYERRQELEAAKAELEAELEEVYLGKARAEREVEELMDALRRQRELEEAELLELLDEVQVVKHEGSPAKASY